MSKLKSFFNNRNGNFSIVFAAALAPISICAAIAIDLSFVHDTKNEIQNQFDSALLAAATHNESKNGNSRSGETPRTREDVALETLAANGYDLSVAKPVFKNDNGYLSLEVDYPKYLLFGGLLSKDKAEIKIASQVTTSGFAALEIALVLDNTESMNFNGKMGALRIGGLDFLRGVQDSGNDAKISIVPFNRYVRVDPEVYRTATWLDIPEEYDTERTWQQATHNCESRSTETVTEDKDGFPHTYEREVCHGRTTTYETQSKTIESRWEGCVGVRGNGLHMVDGGYALDNMPGLLNTHPMEVTGLHRDIEAWCPREITPLTDDFAKLEEEIRNIYGTDKTYLPAGLIWGMRALSSAAPLAETDTDTSPKKIMVLMSDGKNTTFIDESASAEGDMEAPPYVKGLAAEIEAVQANADTATLCTAAKVSGIEVYTIAFQVTDENTKALLENCASTGRHYHNAESNEALIKSFNKISEGFHGEIRIAY